MAEKRGVWGIDIGQAGLKAIRLRFEEGSDLVVADAFDYVQHPKILTQPDAIPEQLIAQALEKFLERNDIKRDKIAMTVPGQNALARFIPLPPVESSKLSEIVKYEAKQQIPFALDDVIWDYQRLGGGVEDSGFMLEAEVGLFAMKRDLVMQQLNPFTQAGLEVELIQIAPLALYNFLSYDILGIRTTDQTAAMDEYTIVLDMGADNTTLLVSNGEKIWIRNVPIGGNHFTRELTKEMKLTFAKAEHLKCNATKSPDPRAVFQALRPVFNNYVSEIQRSIGYFSSVNRDSKISKVIGLGNGFKLAGMQKFLQQNLQYDVERIDSFGAVVGDSVLNAPMFVDNILSFAVSYGVALQAMGLSRIKTSLLPPEIAMARKIRKKKPWAVATAAGLMASLATSVSALALVSESVSPKRFEEGFKAVDAYASKKYDLNKKYTDAVTAHQYLQQKGLAITKPLESRENWLELYKAINECLPRDTSMTIEPIDPSKASEESRLEQEIAKQERMSLRTITFQKVEDLGTWFAAHKEPGTRDEMMPEERAKPPAGPGYVCTLQGVHYHHVPEQQMTGSLYVKETLLKNLQQWQIQRPGSPPFPIRQMGISHAVLADVTNGNPIQINPNDASFKGGYSGGSGRGRGRDKDDDAVKGSSALPGMEPNLPDVKKINVTMTPFTVEFVWVPTPEAKRLPKDPIQAGKDAAAAKPAAPKSEEDEDR